MGSPVFLEEQALFASFFSDVKPIPSSGILEWSHVNLPHVLLEREDIGSGVGLGDKDGHVMRSGTSLLNTFTDTFDFVIQQQHILPLESMDAKGLQLMDALTLLGVLKGPTTKQEMAQKHRAVLVVSNIFQHKLLVVGSERVEDELG